MHLRYSLTQRAIPVEWYCLSGMAPIRVDIGSVRTYRRVLWVGSCRQASDGEIYEGYSPSLACGVPSAYGADGPSSARRGRKRANCAPT